jgi:1-deoxy-D-xylulose-5-phosphate reductoisomerase
MPAVLNSANETAVQAFLQGRIGFLDIERITGETMEKHNASHIETIEDVLHADNWARQEAEMIIERLTGKG